MWPKENLQEANTIGSETMIEGLALRAIRDQKFGDHKKVEIQGLALRATVDRNRSEKAGGK